MRIAKLWFIGIVASVAASGVSLCRADTVLDGTEVSGGVSLGLFSTQNLFVPDISNDYGDGPYKYGTYVLPGALNSTGATVGVSPTPAAVEFGTNLGYLPSVYADYFPIITIMADFVDGPGNSNTLNLTIDTTDPHTSTLLYTPTYLPGLDGNNGIHFTFTDSAFSSMNAQAVGSIFGDSAASVVLSGDTLTIDTSGIGASQIVSAQIELSPTITAATPLPNSAKTGGLLLAIIAIATTASKCIRRTKYGKA